MPKRRTPGFSKVARFIRGWRGHVPEQVDQYCELPHGMKSDWRAEALDEGLYVFGDVGEIAAGQTFVTEVFGSQANDRYIVHDSIEVKKCATAIVEYDLTQFAPYLWSKPLSMASTLPARKVLHCMDLEDVLAHRVELKWDWWTRAVENAGRTVGAVAPAEDVAPWGSSCDKIDVVRTHEAQIIGEDGDDYIVSFPDADGEPVEANIARADFEDMPHPLRIGTLFALVVFRKKGSHITSASVWPVLKYWHSTLQALADVE